MNDIQPHEFRFKRGATIVKYLNQFSATEKMIFGAFVLLALVTTLTMVTKTSNHFSTDIPAYGGTLREGAVGLPRNINPILAITPIDRDISALVYSGLMKYSEGKLVPDLAQSYSVSTDGLTYTFKLKSRTKFHDDAPLTADDIAFTIQKIQDPGLKSPRRPDWLDVTVEVVSPTEIKLILKQPYSPFLGNTTIGIVPKHIWEGVNNEQFIFSQYNIEPVGSGPYKLASISHDRGGIPTSYKLESWGGYYGKEPYIETISFNFFVDENRALEALDQGTIDSLPSISPVAASRLDANKAQAYTVVSTPLPRVFGVFFNQNQSPVLADSVVRRALDIAVDRKKIISNVLKGYGTALHSPVPLTSSTTTGSTFKEIGDIPAAQALLEKNGWLPNAEGIYTKKSAVLSFDIYTADSPDLVETAELVKAAWTAMGARVTVKIYEANDLYQNIIRPRKYDALLFGEAIGKDRDVYAFWHSSQRIAPGLNVALYANSKADKLLEDIRTISNEADRNQKYEQFNSLIQDDIPAVFLYVPDFIYAIPKALKNTNFGSITMASDRWNNESTWHIETEKVWKLFVKD
ncbi:MAG: ABC transporter substrate-binding protein [bacterium]|nr:ABC transporter substrate-binding protein [bacterium]